MKNRIDGGGTAIMIADHVDNVLIGSQLIKVPRVPAGGSWVTLSIPGGGITLEPNGVRALIEWLERFEEQL